MSAYPAGILSGFSQLDKFPILRFRPQGPWLVLLPFRRDLVLGSGVLTLCPRQGIAAG